MPWLPGREELAEIWRVLGVLVQDTAQLVRDLRALAVRVTHLEQGPRSTVHPSKVRRVAGRRRRP